MNPSPTHPGDRLLAAATILYLLFNLCAGAGAAGPGVWFCLMIVSLLAIPGAIIIQVHQRGPFSWLAFGGFVLAMLLALWLNSWRLTTWGGGV